MSQGSHDVDKFCPVSYDLLRLTCEREGEWRASGHYAECKLWEDYDLGTK